MWHFGIWFSRHEDVGWMVGLDDLRGLFQPVILRIPRVLSEVNTVQAISSKSRSVLAADT